MDQLREIDEAVRAADDALAYLRRAARSLGSARNYGVWDILGGGLIVTMLKHSKLDKARVEMENARDAMRRFSDELRDVEALPDVELDIGDFLTLADYFFDGFLALFRVCAAALAARDAFADLKHLAGCFQKLLFIGVDGDEFDALQVAGNHAIDRVVAAPADADHFNIDNCIVVEVVFQRHFLFPPAFYNQGFVRF